MKHFINLVLPTLFALSLIIFSFSDCCKEKQPTIYGKWETVEAFSYHWEYDIEKGGELCRRLPEVFGTTNFCFPYEVNGLTLTLNAPTVEIWAWEFVDYNIAKVSVTAPDGQLYKMILKRLE